MTPFQQLWAARASRLGLSVAIPFALTLDGESLAFPVLLRNFGAQNGMLLVTDFALVRSQAERLVELGYGFSCLSEHTQSLNDDDVLIGMLLDWGWTGQGEPPAWLQGTAE